MGQKLRRLVQVFKYGKKDAEAISRMPDVSLSKSSLFRDILKCYFKYNLWSNEYRKEHFWQLSPEQREEIGKNNQLKRKNQEEWLKEFFANHKFLIKWSSFKYEASSRLQQKRIDAYCRRYNIGKQCFIGHDVLFERHHNLWGTVKIGDNCLIAKHVYIDYSGELVIQDDVALANGVIIETHTHPIEKRGAGAVPGRLLIERGVKVLSNSYISDACHVIGRYARIGAGTYVRGNVPRYAIMMGNPAKIIGFLFSPDEMAEFEMQHYPEDDRTPIEQYRKDYQKYFLDRRAEIKNFIKK